MCVSAVPGQQVCEAHLYGTNRLGAAGHSNQSDKIGVSFNRSTRQETFTWERLGETLTGVLWEIERA